MAHIRLTVNGTTVMDGDLGTWQQQPPQAVADMLRNGGNGKPWHRPLLMVLTDAAVRDQAIDITVTTGEGGYTLDIQDN